MGVLDDDTMLERDGSGRWRGEITDRWTVVGPNGGYLAAFITRALMNEAPFPHPLTMTVHYVARASFAPATVDVEVLRSGRAHATLSARLWQDELVAAALATFGRRREGGPELLGVTMPDVPLPDECVAPPQDAPRPPGFTMRDRFDSRMSPSSDPNFGGAGDGSPTSGGWRRLVDRELDDLAIPLFMDASPPSVWAATGRGAAAPTVEMTVHWRSAPHTPWHLAWFTTSSLGGGYFIENGQLWGEDGALVAESRQLARFVEGDPLF
jgi:acyl-CoA thioesterase